MGAVQGVQCRTRNGQRPGRATGRWEEEGVQTTEASGAWAAAHSPGRQARALCLFLLPRAGGTPTPPGPGPRNVGIPSL